MSKIPESLWENPTERWEVDDHSSINHCSLDINERLEKCQLLERISMLAAIAKRVDNPVWAVSSEDIASLLYDLGCIISYAEDQTQLGDQVGEDPRDISDDLGNCKMFHKKQTRFPRETYSILGSHLRELAAKFSTHDKRVDQVQQELSEFQYELDHYVYDDVEAEDILSAKKRIVQLRRDNEKLDRRNETLWLRNLKLQNRIAKLSSTHPLLTNQENTEPKNICTVQGRGMPQDQSRKLIVAQNSDSQTGNFSW